MRRRLRPFVGVLALFSLPIVGVAGASAAAAATGPGVLSVAGNQFLLNGQPFVPHGFNSIALLNSPWCTGTATAAAAAAFTPTEWGLAKSSWNANTLRFQVSQPVLAGANGAAYAQQIETSVDTVLASGFVVDISMQDQSRACGPGEPLPGAETEAAWSTLVANTALDANPAVMFELFNEPNNQPLSTPATSPSQSTWLDWLSGGRQIGPGTGWAAYVPVGHQGLVNFLRNTLNVPNILIADGASKAGHLEGMPLLQDPSGGNQIAYAVHPYVYTDGPTGWATRWGYLTGTNAVLATEWNYPASGCGAASQQLAPTLLNYLRSTVNVGVLGHALDDFATGLIADSNLTPTQCGGPHQGGGMDFLSDYMSTFAAPGISPPAAPTGLAASYGPSKITLSWSAAQDPGGTVAGYDVYRGTVRVGTATSTTFTDASIKEATAYTYTVDAFDTAGRRGPLSAALVATAPDDQPPSVPTALKLTKGATSITASWTASTDNVGVTGYRIYRNGIALATTTAKTYTDSAVAAGGAYAYQVLALDKAGNQSALSAPQTLVLTDTTKPTAPANLTLSAGTKSITLKWTASTDNVGVTSYRVYRSTTLIATVASPSVSYTNTGLKTGTSYSYHVIAVDAAGNTSASSATVSAKAR